MKSRWHSDGFTLVELLVVVAVIAVLAAIAVPAYSVQMERSREAVDAQNLREACTMAAADYLSEWASDPDFPGGPMLYYLVQAGEGGGMAAQPDPLAPGDPAHITPQSRGNAGRHIEVVVTNGGTIVSAEWVS